MSENVQAASAAGALRLEAGKGATSRPAGARPPRSAAPRGAAA